MLDGQQSDMVAQAPAMFDGQPVVNPRKLPVLIVLHQAHSYPGHIGHWFRDNGHPLDLRRHFDGDPLPKTLDQHCGAVIFGGPQSANDSFQYIREEIDWIGVSLKEKKPFLGVCLGAQMLAQHLGAAVDHCPNGCVEVGYHALRPTENGSVLGQLPQKVYQWHREGFTMPSGAKLLATADNAYPNQAFSYGPAAFGVQFHPEITLAQVNRWSGSNPCRLLMRGARPRHTHFDDHLVHAPKVNVWLNNFLTRWVEGSVMSQSQVVTPA
jgi:GMP synthase (glutamine-hydrolysing)